MSNEFINKPSRISLFLARWIGDWGGRVLAAALLAETAYVLYVFLHWGGEENQALISNLATAIIYAGPSILAFRAARKLGWKTRSGRAWMFIGCAELAFIAATFLWIYYETILGESPFPSWADAGYLAFYPLMLAGLLLLAERMRSAEERLSFALDAGVIMIGATLVLWYFLLHPIAEAYDGDLLKTMLSLAYPIGDLVLLLGISSLLLRRINLGSRGIINILLFGTVINFLADFVFGYQSLIGTYKTGDPTDALFCLATVPVMIAAHVQFVRASSEQLSPSLKRTRSSRFYWVPYLAVVAVYLIVFEVVIDDKYETYEVYSIMAAACVTAMVLFRQFMFVRENIKADLELTALQERIHGIFSASTDAIAVADLNGPIQEVNDSFLRLTGRRHEEVVGKMTYFDFVSEDYLDESITPDTAIESGRPVEYERDFTKKDGSVRNIATTLYSINGANGIPTAMAVVIRDTTHRRALEQQLTHQALHDPLTGLANRILLTDRIKVALARTRRSQSKIAVLYLDLDNFKFVNDTLGHAAGDSLLGAVAERIGSCLRASDTAARIGGDEFIVLLEDLGGTDHESLVAHRLLELVKEPYRINGQESVVGVTIGIAVSSTPDEIPDDLIRKADVAMYTAKREGKNRCAVFQESMLAEVMERAQFESDIRGGLEKDEFEVYYQPMIRLTDESVVGLEALIRWNKAGGKLVLPQEFIGIAEENGLIHDLGEFVINRACIDAARWQRQFPDAFGLTLSVNISSRQVAEASFSSIVLNACESAGFPPENFILEVTESAMLTDDKETTAKLDSLREQGVRLAVDDFGTGYSSLSYLHKFPVDVLKIDRSFVDKINDGDAGAAMSRAIISMSKTLRFTTIAEGIETASQMAKLRDLACDWGQGYHFAKPMNASDTEKYLERQLVQKTLTMAKVYKPARQRRARQPMS